MEITIKNYKTVLPKALLKLAEKNTVRECDETEPGNYVSYVDEGNDSFDVSIKISSEGNITAHTCDCKKGKNFCSHATALLQSIISGKKTATAVKGKKKISAAELLLEDVQVDKLKIWITELLAANKDIELAFIHHFSPQKQSYTTKEVEQLTADAVKSVIKNKKKIDLTELKNILSLWKKVHAPIIEAYSANVSDENVFQNLHTLIEGCVNLTATLNFPGNKVTRYVEEILQQQVEGINNLYSEEEWETATGYSIQYLFKNTRSIRLHYLIHLKNLINAASEPRRKKLFYKLIQQYKQNYSERLAEGTSYTETLFEIAETCGYINEYLTVFKPDRFNNEYNKKLITHLIENKHYQLAEKYANEQIQGNYKEEYNVPYLLLLKRVYEDLKQENKLVEVLHKLFPYTFDFEDFIFISNRMNEEENKKWRTKMLTRARHLSNYNTAAKEFTFRLMEHEKKYKKMIEYVDSYTPYKIILHYFEPMALADKNSLLKAIIERNNESFKYGNSDKDDASSFPNLLALMLKHYPKSYLLAAIKQKENSSWYYRLNGFVEYMKNELAQEA